MCTCIIYMYNACNAFRIAWPAQILLFINNFEGNDRGKQQLSIDAMEASDDFLV